MATVLKTNSDIQLENGTAIVNIRVAGVSFSAASGNAAVHRPRAGLAQALVGHVTGDIVGVDCYINRSDFDAVRGMVGQAVVVRFSYGGSARGVLTSAQASGEPGAWEAEIPYVTVGLSISTTESVVGLV